MVDLDENEPVRHSGSMMAYDDLEVGQHYCVYGLKGSDEIAPIMGQSFQVQAICLPYFVVRLLSDPQQPILTLDSRYLNLMKVDEAFVKAQMAGAMPIPPQRRKKQEE